MLGDDLRVALGRALEHARDERHEYLTTEHLLHALLHDPRAAEIIEACGGDLDAIEEEVTDLLDTLDRNVHDAERLADGANRRDVGDPEANRARRVHVRVTRRIRRLRD